MHSGNKGKRFERKVVELLSAWSGVDLGRTPMSGAWASEPGDIVPLNAQTFLFCIECKHQEGWEFDHLLTGTGPFPEWMAQAVEQAEHKYKLTGVRHWPMLAFTRNRRKTYFMIPREAIELGCIGELPNHIVVIVPFGEFLVGEAKSILTVLNYKKLERSNEQPRTDRAGCDNNLVGRAEAPTQEGEEA